MADERIFDAARSGDVATLTALLDADPGLLHARAEPYGWSLLHLAARQLDAVDLLYSAVSTPTCASRATTPTRCTGPRPAATPTSSAVSPTPAATSSGTATITSSR